MKIQVKNSALLFVYRAAAVILTICIFNVEWFLDVGNLIHASNRLTHILVFFSLTLIYTLAFAQFKRLNLTLAVIGIASVAEALQSQVGLADWIADCVGVFMAIVPMLLATVQAKKVRRSSSLPKPMTPKPSPVPQMTVLAFDFAGAAKTARGKLVSLKNAVSPKVAKLLKYKLWHPPKPPIT